ncbi:putative FBD domain, leucine-rich repeat domain superfamily, F-box-like domain superfamily [Helianthus annuus]|nr:putative FBD domain, leucine-rich repeat domain superfamily, F-box-like domain superfamily [Helianthus annuus]
MRRYTYHNCKSQQEYPNKMDRISKLPLGIIETILCLLPIQEAARTSILSREWRYLWTKIPNLVFIEKNFQVSTDRTDRAELSLYNKPSKRRKMSKKSKFIDAIYQVLLIHEGPIHEFTLDMQVDDSGVEIDHILLHLSKKNTLKMLNLDIIGDGYEGYVLPISLFSLHQLTELYLNDCALFHERPFTEFRCLTTLYLNGLSTYDTTLLRLLSSCPVLKRLMLYCDGGTISDSRRTTIVDLFKCVPMIEFLSVRFFIVTCFVPERLPKVLPTPLVDLKYLCMDHFCFSHKYGLPFLALLMRSFPNLEKFKLVMYEDYWLDEDEMSAYTLEDYSDIMLENLNEFHILNYRDAEDELDFVKFILAKSPVLKKVGVFPCVKFDEEEESKILKSLSLSPCAAPVGEVVIHLEPN